MTTPPPTAADKVLVAGFLAAVALPGLLMLCRGPDSAEALLGERSAPAPALPRDAQSLRQWPDRFRSFFNAGFALRLPLIRAAAHAKVDLLGVTSTTKVMLGREGWLYLASENEDDCIRRARPFSETQLEDFRKTLEERRARLAERGIAYLVFVAPDKHTIYPEFLPRSVRPADGPSRLDQLASHLAARSDFRLVDLRGTLREVKRAGPAYLRLDTHWNDLGAFAAYQAIAAELRRSFPSLPVETSADFVRDDAPPRNGDLARMLGLPELVEDFVPRLAPTKPRRAVFVEGATGPVIDIGGGRIDRLVTSRPGAPIRRAVVFRDSFLSPIVPLLSEHFERAVYAWRGTYDEKLVEKERPDVVVQELVERTLMIDRVP